VRRRFGPPSRSPEKTKPTPGSQWARKSCRGECSNSAAAAVVVTVIVDGVVVSVPVAFIEEGLNTHVAPAGSPEQARVIVPVNPVEDDTFTDVDPDAPGALIAT